MFRKTTADENQELGCLRVVTAGSPDTIISLTHIHVRPRFTQVQICMFLHSGRVCYHCVAVVGVGTSCVAYHAQLSVLYTALLLNRFAACSQFGMTVD